MNIRLAIAASCVLGLLGAAACDGGDADLSPGDDETAVDASPGRADSGSADGGDDGTDGGDDGTGDPDAAPDPIDATVTEEPDAGPPPSATACNGADVLCGRRYDEVAYVTTHNAMSSEEDGFFGPNQYFGIGRQLADGVRGLMLDVHDDNGQPALCHGVCFLGKTPMGEGLGAIRDFLDDHPREVVTIIFESYVDGPVIERAFADADLVRLVHTQAVGQPWPTLGAMIEANRRLVVLTDRPGGPAWNMDVWAHAWETHFSAANTSNFSCNPNRGNIRNPLFIFNHFLTRTLPVPREAPTTNGAPLLPDRLSACRTSSGRLPNFVTVDFYSVGVVREAVDQLNGL
jgi:hypothetical protein